MRERSAECFIVRLSFLLLLKLGSEMDFEEDKERAVLDGRGRVIRPEPAFEVEDFARIEGRFLGAVGAWWFVSLISW